MKLKTWWRKQLKILGPGLITGASDDDPSGIAVYAQAGAQFGYLQLWTALFTFPFMAVIQEMCGRIGLVTGKGLSGVLRRYYPKSLLYLAVALILVANIINIGADLAAMTASLHLIIPIPFPVAIIAFTILIIALEIGVSYTNYARLLKYLTLSLLAYIATMFIVGPNWKEIFIHTLRPTWINSQTFLFSLVGILGTTISPYLFFWQADQEVEEEVMHHKIKGLGIGKPHINLRDLRLMRQDTWLGMFFSNLTMFFIIGTTAATLHLHGITDITQADQAALALRPLAGNSAFLLFALGVIGTGMLAVPILAGSSSYALGEALNWKIGLYRKFRQARPFYLIILVSVVVGLLINVLPVSPFQLLYWSAILNALVASPLMILILLIANNSKIMGKYTNRWFSNLLGILITIVMAGGSLLLCFYYFSQVK